MANNREVASNAVSGSSNASVSNLQDAMWRLKAHGEENSNKNSNNNNNTDNQELVDGHNNPYPDHPVAADCIYYMRMGVCGFGSNCRYNHPTYDGQMYLDSGELPERVGQPNCQYFLKTGTCKFGATCKYHHPRDRHVIRPVALNVMGLPLHQDEKSCPYYMRNGTCKFGIACKFNHPQPAAMGAAFPATGAPTYESLGSSTVPSSSVPLIGGLSTWPLARPLYLSSPHMQSLPAYMPVVFPPSQGTMPIQQGWSTYMCTMQTNPSNIYVNQGNMDHLPSSDVLVPIPTSSTKPYAQSGSSTTTSLPERPNQPECQYYMKTGRCKYGTTCKYDHPRRNLETSSTLGPFGLPLRPGRAVCTFYSTYGGCCYGSACKFDHPLVGYYNYAVPVLPAPDPSTPFPPNERCSPLVTWTAVTDTSPIKTTKLADSLLKYEETSNSELNDTQNNNEHCDNPLQLQTSASSHTVPSSESPKIPL